MSQRRLLSLRSASRGPQKRPEQQSPSPPPKHASSDNESDIRFTRADPVVTRVARLEQRMEHIQGERPHLERLIYEGIEEGAVRAYKQLEHEKNEQRWWMIKEGLKVLVLLVALWILVLEYNRRR